MKSIGRYEGIAVKPTKAHDYLMVGQSQASAYAESLGSSTSGIRSLEDAVAQLAEGGYAIDKRHLSWDVACACISGPMCSASLPQLSIRYLGSIQTFISYSQFESYVETHSAKGGNLSLHFISMDLYAEWWRRKGARVGRKVKGMVEWKPAYSGPLFEAVS